MSGELRRGALLGLTWSLPLVVWWAFQDLSSAAGAAPAQSPLSMGLRALWISQVVTLPLIGVCGRPEAPWWKAALELGYATLVPLPLYVLPWLSGALPVGSLVRGALALPSYGAVLAAGGQLIDGAIRKRGVLQGAKRSALVLLAAFAWAHRGVWLGWLVPG